MWDADSRAAAERVRSPLWSTYPPGASSSAEHEHAAAAGGGGGEVRRPSLRKPPASPPKRGRLVDRDSRFGQSRGTFNISRQVSTRVRTGFYLADWFHTLVNTKSYRIVIIVISVYLALFFGFALLYMAASAEEGCFSDLYVPIDVNASNPHGRSPDFGHRFVRATFFSLETMMTIGYGVDDPYFGDCAMMLCLVILQTLVGLFASSILLGIVLTRVSRADLRAGTVAFSAKAIVRVAYNELYLVLRVAEMRKHQLTQSYVHAYAMADSGDVIGDVAAPEEGSSVHALPMALAHPTGEMMLVTPCFIVHRLDSHSPLIPPDAVFDEDADSDDDEIEPAALLRALQAQPSVSPAPRPRQSTIAGRQSPNIRPSAGPLSVSGPGDESPERAPSFDGRAAPLSPDNLTLRLRRRLQLVKDHMVKVNAEVLVLLEGIDSTTSSTVQARQSYTVDDICWDATFVPCARRQPSGGILIDFDKLHDVLPLGTLVPTQNRMRMPTHDRLPIPRTRPFSLSEVSSHDTDDDSGRAAPGPLLTSLTDTGVNAQRV